MQQLAIYTYNIQHRYIVYALCFTRVRSTEYSWIVLVKP